MAVFTGKQILKAVFTNNSNDTIEVIYNHKDEGEPPEYISVWVPATDPTNYELIGLKEEGWSLERIQRETHAHLEQQKQAHDARLFKMVESKVKEQLEYYYQIVNEEANARIKAEVDKYYEIVNENANARIKAELEKYYEEAYNVVNEEANARIKAELDRYYQEADSKVKQDLDKYYEQIERETKDTKQKIAQMYEQRYNEMLDTGPAVTTNVLQAVIDNNTDEDILFKTKLAVFDLQKVKDLKDRATKQKIRTAKSLMELFGALGPVLEES